jgi:16S rRNA A1518/A1519 N6-dimethyltransferase RsmA/KsgA/DIM1 with predicted DNA glycosylase/AP lyase activity
MIVTKDYIAQYGLDLNVNKKNNKFGCAGYLLYIYGLRKSKTICSDALKIDYKALAGGEKIKVIANLPYYIATELLFCWLDNIESFSALYLMFQKVNMVNCLSNNSSNFFTKNYIYLKKLYLLNIDNK